MVFRYDKACITDFKETSEGYLTINACPVTRPGVFPYLRQDGQIEMEAKLPEELFSEKTIASAHAKPITDDHPSELVTAANYAKYAKGLTHTDAAVKDNKLVISFTVTDSATIQKIRDGKRELSIGFTADVQQENGSYSGEKYDSVQRNMEINHIAIVDKGRAGPTIAIRGDSACMVTDDKKQGGRKMPTIKIDSVDYEVDSVVKARIDALEAQVESSNVKASEVDKITGERDALQAKVNTLESELETEKAKVPTVDALDELVKNRIELTNKATTFLGDSYDFAGKSDREVKEAVIVTADKEFKGDGKSDDYVNAYFDAMTAGTKEFTADAAVSKGRNKGENEEESVEELRKKRLEMNKQGGK